MLMADPKPRPDGTLPVSDRETEIAYSGPAPVVNRLYSFNTSTGMRLAFCEEFDENLEAQFRCAIYLNHGDAVALRDLLIRQLEAHELSEAANNLKSDNG
jgi:hypothetical protein